MLATFVFATALSAVAAPPAFANQRDTTVEQAAREFRISTYDTFRTNRDEYDARRALGDELLIAWIKADLPAEHREAVFAWFKSAGRSGEGLSQYAQIEELRNVTLTVELPGEAATFEPVSPSDLIETPASDEKPVEEKKSVTEGLFNRLKKTIWSGKTKDAVEPPAAK